MNAEEIIESGMLEGYAAGLLSLEEVEQVEGWCAEFPQVKSELRRIEVSLESYARLHAVKPPDFLKEKIRTELRLPRIGETKMVRFDPMARWAMAASVLLIGLLSFTSWHFYNRGQVASQRLAELQSERSVMANQVRFMENKNASDEMQLAVVNDTSKTKVMLNGLALAPQSKAMIYWNHKNGQAYINFAYLPPAPENSQYQLWAIVDGKPVDMGVLSKDSTFQQAKDVMNAKAFAITLEAMGGNPTPTMEKMYVLGNV